ncbi:unnamed protein product [Cylindrotheca closterium]|uniref:HSF-type DNA-binding domain-containing protein n=1 Tax=Cylindrotheca closterium TaxID=2856 RepID=A0AAD2FGG4_9STRA|nr:unnamed protein product [Cylindrotheca closterium]
MTAESETMSAAEDLTESTESKEALDVKTEKKGEESTPEVTRSEGDPERKDEGSIPPAIPVDKEKYGDSSESKVSEGQESSTIAAPMPNYPQAQPQLPNPYVQYVPPYQAIVRGLTGDAVGSKDDDTGTPEEEESKGGYKDYSKLSDPVPDGRNRGGVMEVFPVKLHRMLRQTEYEGKADIVSFCPHGRAFNIHKPKRFEAEIMTRYFRQTRVQSFQRQLNLYGFKRITRGPDTGGYYHERFLRGRPGLCVNMQRVRIKGVPKQPDDPDSEPDFYSLPTLPDVASNFPQHIPMHHMIPPHMFTPYMYPMPAGVAGPYTIAQTHPPGLHPYAAAQFGKNGAPQSMPQPYGSFPFPYPMMPQQCQEKVSLEATTEGGEMKPPEAKTENVDIVLDNTDVSEKVDV